MSTPVCRTPFTQADTHTHAIGTKLKHTFIAQQGEPSAKKQRKDQVNGLCGGLGWSVVSTERTSQLFEPAARHHLFRSGLGFHDLPVLSG